MEKPFFFFHIYLFFLIFLLPKAAYPFSLGHIKVKSRFGEKFDAYIDVYTDGSDGLKAEIGSREDYLLLGAYRSNIIDDIELTVLPYSKKYIQGDTLSSHPPFQKIRLFSKKFLFYPSLELIIKATLDGGTIMEKYLLTVDFHRDLRVSLFDDKGSEKKEDNTKVRSILSTAQNNTDLYKEHKKEVTASQEIKKEEDIKKEHKEKKKRLLKVDGKLAAIPDIKKESAISAGKNMDLFLDRHGSGGKGKNKKAYRRYGPVKKGDNLFSIADKLNISGYYKEQVVVALWMNNKNKFVANNMNKLMSGVYLYTDIEDELGKLSLRESFSIIKRQHEQWKAAAPRALRTQKISRLNNTFPYIVSFGGDLTPIRDIQLIINNWKKAWEKGDIEDLMGYYSTAFRTGKKDFVRWKRYKKRLINKYDKTKISVGNMEIIKLDDKDVYASFIQKFSSVQMNSVGLKTLKFIYNGRTWLITDEIWDGTVSMPRSSPFVIHVSSVANLKDAEKEITRFKNLGYNAYYSFTPVPEKGRWYRIFIDRFSYKKTAVKLAENIKKKGHSSYALVMNMPYAMDYGNFDSSRRARALLKKLSVNNTISSPYLFAFNTNPVLSKNMSYKVLAGAYAVKEQVVQLLKESRGRDISYKVAAP